MPVGDLTQLTPTELAGLARSAKFSETGSGYAMEQATRPSTIGHAVASSPLALLAWIGEKYLDGMLVPATQELILRFVSLYWLTQTYPTSIYMYRQVSRYSQNV